MRKRRNRKRHKLPKQWRNKFANVVNLLYLRKQRLKRKSRPDKGIELRKEKEKK